MTTPPLRRSYRICLRFYPRSYRLRHGDDLAWLIADLHEDEQTVSVRECLSIMRAGTEARVRGWLRYGAAVIFLVEGALALLTIGVVSDKVATQRPFLNFLSFGTLADQIRVDWWRFLLFVVPLGLLAMALLWASVRAASNARRSCDGLPRRGRADQVFATAQPLGLAIAALGGWEHGDVAVAVLIAGGVLFGGLIAVTRLRRDAERRRTRLGLATVLPLLLLLVPVLVYANSRSRLTDFTSQYEVANGRPLPLWNTLSCDRPAHCDLLAGEPWAWSVFAPGQPVGFRAVLTLDRGRWSYVPTRVPGISWISQLDCPTANVCFVSPGSVGGGSVLRTTNGGRTWTSLRGPVTWIEHCFSAQDCIGESIGGSLWVTVDGGTAWRRPSALPKPNDYTQQMFVCSGARDCMLIGQRAVASLAARPDLLVLATTDRGRSWHTRLILERADEGSDVVAAMCPRAGHCLVYIEDSGSQRVRQVLATSDGGVTWRAWMAGRGAVGPAPVWPLPCTPSGVCASPGSPSHPSAVRVFARGRWSTLLPLPTGERASEVVCWSQEICVALVSRRSSGVDHFGIEATYDGGRQWNLQKFPSFPSAWLPAATRVS